MAATQIIHNEVDESFETGCDEFTRYDDYVLVSESQTSTRPQYAKSSVADCASLVEAWIKEEFGDDEDASHAMHDEADSDSTLRQLADEFIGVEDLKDSTMDSVFDDLADTDSEDSEESEMCYEPQLWSFT